MSISIQSLHGRALYGTILPMVTFLNEVRGEMAKVTWPTRSETIRLTAIVIAISIFIGIYLGAADYLFTLLLQFLVK